MAPLLTITNAGGGLEAHVSQHLLTSSMAFKSITTCTSSLGNKMPSGLVEGFFLFSFAPVFESHKRVIYASGAAKILSIKLRSFSPGPRLPSTAGRKMSLGGHMQINCTSGASNKNRKLLSR